MKAEERILELLAEYLQKTDKLLDRMEQTDRNVDIMSKAILEHSIKFNQVTNELKRLGEDTNRLSVENNHMREDQGIVLQELLSISKRVSNLES